MESGLLRSKSEVQLLSWQGGGARTPQHQCLDEIIFKNMHTTTKTPLSYLCPDMAIGKCPLDTASKFLFRWSLMQSGNGIVQRGFKFRLDWEAVISENNENRLNKNDNSQGNAGWFFCPRNLWLRRTRLWDFFVVDHLSPGLAQLLAHSGHLVNICWKYKFISEWITRAAYFKKRHYWSVMTLTKLSLMILLPPIFQAATTYRSW